MTKQSNFKEEEIGTIKLMETETLKVRIINNKDFDVRVWVETPKYSGPTKKGVRFSLLNNAWPQFKQLMEIVDSKQKQLNESK